MHDVTQQAILTLSSSIQKAAAKAVGSATFARFYDARIERMVREGVYAVAMDGQIIELPVYGNGVFKDGQHAYVISPHNAKSTRSMFILGIGGNGADEDSEDHELLMKLIGEVNNKLDAGIIVQEAGQSTTTVMSQKAVTDLVNSIGFDGIQGVVLGSNVLEPNPANDYVTIPIANSTNVGVVRANPQQNGVAVANDGTMSVESIDLMRVHQLEDNTLILDGGNASTWI